MTLEEHIVYTKSAIDKILPQIDSIQIEAKALSERIAAIESRNTGPMIVSKWKFRSKFTVEERVAIETAASTDSLLRVLRDDLLSLDYVDLAAPDTIASVNLLVSKSLLTQDRATTILTP